MFVLLISPLLNYNIILVNNLFECMNQTVCSYHGKTVACNESKTYKAIHDPIGIHVHFHFMDHVLAIMYVEGLLNVTLDWFLFFVIFFFWLLLLH